jgi:phage shock protein B
MAEAAMSVVMAPVFGAIAIIFVLIVLPLWLSLHYSTRWRQARLLTVENENSLAEFTEITDRLQARIDNLERLLDVSAPEWRKKS